MNSKPAAERTLYLLPVWLGETGGVELLPPANILIAERITLFFAEHEKTARHMLRRMVPAIDLPSLEIHRLDKDTDVQDIDAFIALLRDRDGAILSEAGMPCIADPGARLVAAAHRAGIRVVPLTGPSSIMLALAASGLNGQNFTFHGYLPKESAERQRTIRVLEQSAERNGAAHLFIETPYRNEAMFDELLRTCAEGTLLCIATEIGQPDEAIATRAIAQWKSRKPLLKDRPTVFILGKRTV